MTEQQRAIMDLKNRAHALARTGGKLDQNFCDDLIDVTVEVLEKVLKETSNTVILSDKSPSVLSVPWRTNLQSALM